MDEGNLVAIIGTISKILTDLPTYLAALVAVFVSLIALISALIGFFLMIPGEQPEKFLYGIRDKMQAFTDWVKQYSRKKE